MSGKLRIDIDKAIEIAEWYNGKRTVLGELIEFKQKEKEVNPIAYTPKIIDKKKQNSEKNLYKREFKQNRKIVLIIDNYKCRECGTKDNLHVHHIKEKSQGGTNDINNLITLCEKCHSEMHKDENVYNIMVKRLKRA